MKHQIMAALFAAGMLYAGPAFAHGEGEHPNGTVQAMMMANGNVEMMVTIPEKEFKAIDQGMKTGTVACTVKEMLPGSTDTIVFDCDNAQSVGG